MEEVKNEGLEVVAVIEIGDPDHETGACDSLEFIPREVEFIDGEKLCRHSEALAGYAVRDAPLAEQEAQIKALQGAETSWQSGYDEGRRMGGKHCMLTVDQLRAELADAKETITRYETTAENCDVLRAELAAIKSAQVAKQDYGQLTCDYCGAETRDPWHGSGSINGIESKHIHACDNCRDLLPVAKQVVLPDADHSEDVRAMVLPDRSDVHASSQPAG